MQEEKWFELWKAGKTDQEISQSTDCSISTVCRWRNSQKLPVNKSRSRMQKETQAQLVQMIVDGIPLHDIAAQTGIFVETIRKLAVRRGLQYSRKNTRTPAREVHGTLGYGGYVELRVDLDGPYGNLVKHGHENGRTGYALLHRMRMQDHLGRELLPTEHVHHIDGDIYNNSIANLQLFPSMGEHQDHHRKTQVVRCKESADRWPGSWQQSTRKKRTKTDGQEKP